MNADIDDSIIPDENDEGLEQEVFSQSSAVWRRGEGHESLVPTDPFHLYISKIRSTPSLSHEEEMELAKRFRQTGDRDAAYKLVTSNLMLVVKIAYEFRTQFQNMLDLIQEGNYGLLRAVQKFDPFKGVRLSTYASYWIRAYMLKYLLDNWRLVRVGTTNAKRKLLYNLKEIQSRLEEGGMETDSRLLAEKFGASEQDVIDIQQSLGAMDTSINQPVGDEDGRELVEMISSGANDMADDLSHLQIMKKFQSAIGVFKKELRPVELDLLEKRILSDVPLTLRELGEIHGVTREAIRQTEERLMKRLKIYLTKELKGVGEIHETMKKE
ncbi:MAG: sigma-70 family RNA polymerase sigma factor [Nitrospinae bacterium]|nr:sigma-70 family RNA polymerase sigma factor [Nitrospinota bacterium]